MRFSTTSELHDWWHGTRLYEGIPVVGGIEGLMTASPAVFRAWKSQLNSNSAKRFSRFQQVKISVVNYLQRMEITLDDALIHFDREFKGLSINKVIEQLQESEDLPVKKRKQLAS